MKNVKATVKAMTLIIGMLSIHMQLELIIPGTKFLLME